MRLYREFQALLDRHAAALAACDRITAALVARVGHPRVRLPPDGTGHARYAADAAAIAQAVPPGRTRQRLARRLRRCWRRWDAQALALGLTEAQLREAALDRAVLAAADALLAAPAWTHAAVIVKLAVLLAVHEPGPCGEDASPGRELRRILADLHALAAPDGGPA